MNAPHPAYPWQSKNNQWPSAKETEPHESWWLGKSREELDALAMAHQNRMRYSPHGVNSAVRFGEFMPPPIKPEKPR